MSSYKRAWRTGKLALLIAVLVYSPVAAQTSSSPRYKTNEYFFGSGGDPNLNSDDYSANASLGSLGVGSSSSDNYDAEAGFLTPSEPFLEMVVTEDTVAFGNLPTNSSASGAAQGGGCSCSFNVRSYLTSSYVVQTVSNPPTSENGDSLDAKTALGAPSTSASVEEFGMNLVANTTPALGADPVNIPDNSFGNGAAETGYNTPNQFKYGVGDIIARSPSDPNNPAIGQTNYTITYIAKKTDTTPAGNYVMDHVMVVVATY